MNHKTGMRRVLSRGEGPSERAVKEAGSALGYRQPAAFVEMFRGILGTTPRARIHALKVPK